MDTSDHITIPLTRGYSTVIDAIDINLIGLKWNVHIENGKCYAYHYMTDKGNRITVFMHRVILSHMLGRELLPNEHPIS